MTRVRQFLTSDWKQWIAENLLKEAIPADLERILIANGFEQNLVRLELETAAAHPYIAAARSISRQLAKRDWLLHSLRSLRDPDSTFHVAERPTIGGEEFRDHFYQTNRPLVLRGFVNHWPARSLWTADYLKQRCSNCEVEVQAGRSQNPRFEVEPEAHRKRLQFNEFVDYCFSGMSSNDMYMTARNGSVNGSVLNPLQRDLGNLDEFLDPASQQNSLFLWFGPGGTITPLHHDLTNNFMIQLVGSKRVRLISPDSLPFMYNDYHVYSAIDLDAPDPERYPNYRHLHILEVTIQAGDILFLPLGWWHHVEGLSTSMTITCTNFRWPNDFSANYSTTGAI